MVVECWTTFRAAGDHFVASWGAGVAKSADTAVQASDVGAVRARLSRNCHETIRTFIRKISSLLTRAPSTAVTALKTRRERKPTNPTHLLILFSTSIE
jgi:hypothetical protein